MQFPNHGKITIAVALGLIIGGCSLPDGAFPSLAKRPYENVDPVAEPPSEPTVLSTRIPDTLRVQLDALLTRHAAAERAFRAALPAARQLAQAGSGTAAGSENWVAAQMEISRLEKKRAESLAALAEMDRLVSGERDKAADAGLIALIEPSQEKIRRDVDAQTTILVELATLIG